MRAARSLGHLGRRLRAGGAARGSSSRAFAAGSDSAGPPSPPAEALLPAMSAAVLVERLPVVIPKPPDWFLSYEQFSFERSQQHRKAYPADFVAAAAEPPSDDSKRALPEGQVDIHTTTDSALFYDDPSRRTQADVANDTKSVQRALDRRLYLLVKGAAVGVGPEEGPQAWRQERWRLPEAVYAREESLRLCAEGAVGHVITNSHEDVYFVGNAPFAHLEAQSEEANDAPAAKRLFFWAHWVGQEAVPVRGNSRDYAWVTKEELLDQLSGTQEREILDELLLE